ncbi:TPA: hypothetical protein ACFNMW_001723 [Neisseria lactamica]|nr:hypothetical protein [Neisseria lactamica]
MPSERAFRRYCFKTADFRSGGSEFSAAFVERYACHTVGEVLAV